jgi:hypothetical protein
MKLLINLLAVASFALPLNVAFAADHDGHGKKGEHAGHDRGDCCDQKDCCKDCDSSSRAGDHKDGMHSCCDGKDKAKADECCKKCDDEKCKKACKSGKCKKGHCDLKKKGDKAPQSKADEKI